MNHPLISNKAFNYHFIKKNDVFELSNAELKIKTKNFIFQLNKVHPKTRIILSLLSNSIYWNYVDHAALLSNWIHVPLNENLTLEEIKLIIDEVQPDVIVYSKKRHFRILEQYIKPGKIKIININADNQKEESSTTLPKVDFQSTAIILYTSGSTSLMKGVKHSHASLINAIEIFSEQIKPFNAKRALSYLPLSFSGERKLNYTYQHLGIDICYASTSKSLIKNILLFKPDIMALVPSLLERLINDLEEENIECSLKYIVCGGAAIRDGVKLRYLKLGIKVIEVYGLTETASLGTINLLDNLNKINSAGKPLPNVDIKISAENEVYISCNSLLQSYLNQSVDLVVINGKKYIKSGDSGYLDEDNYLHINGRINDQIKLQNGTWLVPQEVEKKLIELSKNQFDRVIVFMSKSNLTAIIITEMDCDLVQVIIDNYNNNGFICIDEVVVKSKSFFGKEVYDFKFSRKKVIENICN